MTRLLALLAALALATAACGGGDDPVTSSDGPPAADRDGDGDGGEATRYTATATVLESPEHGPQLCLGGIATSLPPQCGGPDVVGWDWEQVDWAQTEAGTTWAEVTVEGTWDGERFTLTEPPAPADVDPAPPGDAPPPTDFTTPCPEPEGGWAPVDPGTATDEALQAALALAREHPDFGGAWVDQDLPDGALDDLPGPEPTTPAGPGSAEAPDDPEGAAAHADDPARLVLNLRFTGDLDAREAEVRDVWGGALCVSEAERPLADLLAVQEELSDRPDVLSSSVDEVRGVVHLGVVVAEDALRQELDDRYGEGTVELAGALRPV